jgi:hypothetical protein
MAIAKMAQTDLKPSTVGNTTGLHFHSPAGQSAVHVNNPSDFPNAAPNASAPSGGKAVSVKIAQSNGGPRFSNPS